MSLFVHQISNVVAWAIPRHGPADNNRMSFKISVPDIAERIEAVPEITNWFTDIVVTYAITGRIGLRFNRLLPPGYLKLSLLLGTSLEYFVLGHEYAHIISGDLDATTTRKGVMPATKADVLVYSWQQELMADLLGMIVSLRACRDHEEIDTEIAFLGIILFFDVLDVMDRAVALLQTGDENARQLGSHPPSDLRRQRLREAQAKFAESLPADDAEPARRSLELAEIQTEIIRLLWERTRPILLDLYQRGVPAAPTWRTILKETGDEPTPAPQSAPEPKQARRRGLRWGGSR
jgi:hypothetical protein